MKRVFALLLALVMVFALAACGASAEEKIADFVKENESELVDELLSSAKSADPNATASIEAVGTGLVITMKFSILEDLSASDKNMLQQQYDGMASNFEGALEKMQKDLPELEYYKVRVCDKNGELLATVVAGNKSAAGADDNEEGTNNELNENSKVELLPPSTSEDEDEDENAGSGYYNDELNENSKVERPLPGNNTTTDAAADKIAAYVAKNKAELLGAMEQSFATSSGMTCTSSIEAIGRGFVIKININEFDNISADIKKQLQDAYDAQQATFDGLLDNLKAELPEAEYMEIDVCEKDGDVLAVIRAGK